MARSPQLQLLKKAKLSYGGELLKTRKGRSGARPLATRSSMHLVLRSSKAKGPWSFRKPENDRKIRGLIKKFSVKYGVRVLSLANVGNHLHFQIQLTSRYAYRPFIRALTGAIAMTVTGRNRWTANKSKLRTGSSPAQNGGEIIKSPMSIRLGEKLYFWDYRPFTRIIVGFKALLGLRDYIHINQLEGYGATREDARILIWEERFRSTS